jgi:hypothetical protein
VRVESNPACHAELRSHFATLCVEHRRCALQALRVVAGVLCRAGASKHAVVLLNLGTPSCLCCCNLTSAPHWDDGLLLNTAAAAVLCGVAVVWHPSLQSAAPHAAAGSGAVIGPAAAAAPTGGHSLVWQCCRKLHFTSLLG